MEVVATKLTSPWGITPLRDGSIMICERDTRLVKLIKDGKTTELTTIEDANPLGEGGLLGLVASPDEKLIFVYFTTDSDNRIAVLSWDGSRLGEPKVILSGIPSGGRHNGGRMIIDAEKTIFVGTGEAGDEKLAQDKKSLAGKILRITFDGKPARGNPFDDEVYSYGHRNVQGLAFDDAGRLWASEFGDQTWDELNRIVKGKNYGWPAVEGSGKVDGMTNPSVVWSTDEASPSGLAFWNGSLYMAALRGQRLWEIPVTPEGAGEPKPHFGQKYGRLRSVVVSADGDSLLLTTSNTDGRAEPGTDDDQLLKITR